MTALYYTLAALWTLALVAALAYAVYGIRRATAGHRRRDVPSRPRTIELDPDRDPKGNP